MKITKKNMIESQLKPEGISCSNTMDCISKINREDFVPKEFFNLSYAECDIPLKNNFKMLRPLTVARILQLLQISKNDEILEVGTGSGYLTCCLSKMGNFVDTIDMDKEMLSEAKKIHKKYNTHNINYINADVFSNWTTEKKYDVIVITGSIDSRMEMLEQLLKNDGRMFAVIGTFPVMNVNIIKRVSDDKLIFDVAFETILDPLKNINKKNYLNF